MEFSDNEISKLKTFLALPLVDINLVFIIIRGQL